jgi:uncharacterized membrane protein SpoIIM required for sporulation
MHPDEIYRTRKAEWEKLNTLLNRSQSDLHRLSAEEVQLLGQLYRAATSDLSLAQRDFPGHELTAYLNQLVARAHAIIYRSEPLARQRLVHFATSGFPRAYRQAFPFILVAMLLFLIPALGAGLATAWRPEAARWLLPEQVQTLIPTIEERELWTKIPIEERPYASSFILRNNIQVAFLAFGSGMLAGLPTLWVLVVNGLILGGLSGLTAHYGIGFELWTFIIGHGVIELSVIFMAGGSGLALGWAILHPGLRPRREALREAANLVVRLVVGCIPLLILAGIIEGNISPAENIPWAVKWGVGLGSGVILYIYLLIGGRKEKLKPDFPL